MNKSTFSDTDTKARALNDVYKMLAYSYNNVSGGFLYKPLELLSKENTTWHVCLQNGNLKCVMIHKDTHVGKKVILCGCDGTKEGKRYLLEILLSCLSNKEERYYCEASDIIEQWLIKRKVQVHSNEWAAELLEKNGEDIEYSDDGIHYFRKINGVFKRKAIYGNIGNN